MKIFLTKLAERNYREIKNYILKEWGKRIADAFEDKTNDFLDILEKFPELGTIEVVQKQIRGFQFTKQIKIFYRIKNNRIIILAFFDVRQDPSKKPQ